MNDNISLENVPLNEKKITISASFSDIVEQNLFFCDKTLDILKLLEGPSYVFIRRPPLFGKTMTLDILHNLLEGNKEIFEKLNAKCLTKWDFSQKFPVLHLNFKIPIISYEHFVDSLTNYFFIVANQLEVNLQHAAEKSPNDILRAILDHLTLHHTQKIVVLIDDFDFSLFTKPETLPFRHFVSLLGQFTHTFLDFQDSIQYLFAFGIHNFSTATTGHFDIFPPDHSDDKKYADIFGFTENDISQCFKDRFMNIFHYFHVNKIQNIFNENTSEFNSNSDIIQYLSLCYGGYRFSNESSISVINPYDILSLFQHEKLDDYWLKVVLQRDFLYSSPILLKKFSNLFQVFPNFDSSLHSCIEHLIKGNLSLLKDTYQFFDYIINYGFLTFSKIPHVLGIPNTSMYCFLSNIIVSSFASRFKTPVNPLHVEQINQGNIQQLIDTIRLILIGKSDLTKGLSTPFWEFKIFAVLTYIGLIVNIKMPQSDEYFYSECETLNEIIHLFVLTNMEPSRTNFENLLKIYRNSIVVNPNKKTTICCLNCISYSHALQIHATWNSTPWEELNEVFNDSQFEHYTTPFFQAAEQSKQFHNVPNKNISFTDIIMQSIILLDEKEHDFYSLQQISKISANAFYHELPKEDLYPKVLLACEYLFETKKLKKEQRGTQFFYGLF
ncbi:hypothetical protein TRFO_13504 [Tritrichomonas foetus]|uniref:AAA-ATPase-like domain-containing protein n=1 Tax=Tritrichomonas foetus TaxID=1144522 RepID=A0A1J4L228_9EUKA|nr:hypothetical protein TRFO_13504 [Tritrichomonas foetus]|eukprot:OHT16020.1 hypothetical protein TRFO_13504 [Tritrichomonas foetus]